MRNRLATVYAATGAGIGAASFALSQGGAAFGGRWWLASLGMAMGAGGVVGWVGGRRMTARIAPIATAAAQLAEGRPPHVAHERSPRRDELGLLASSIQEMAVGMERRIAAVAEDRTRFAAVLSGMVEGVLVLDRLGRVLLVNPALEQMLGCRPDEAIGHRWIEIVRQHDLNELIAAVLTSGEPKTAEVVVDELNGPRTFAVQGSVARRPDAGDAERRSVFVFHDVTALKRLERVRSDFIANVSHELRTPLTSIIGYLEALLDGAHEEPRQREEFLQIMKTHADRLNALVNDLLQLSQIESGQYQWRRDSIDVVELVRRSVGLVAPLAQRRQITLRCEGKTPPLHVIADAEKLTQVLLNLLDNALKYTEEGGQVDVEVEAGQGVTVIRVRDTGIGIPSSDQQRIFERFYRVDRARSRALGGTGLGLSIVKHIVEAHGGTVAVESRLGAGSTFRVTLPTQPHTELSGRRSSGAGT
ncbi:MAG: PAS domain S-box protein [Nitrospirae bacterium]|nr:PAS domain S-box protein [Nitrospirota bacterium]